MTSPFHSVAIAPQVDDAPASALHVRPRDGARPNNPRFPPRVVSRLLPIALVEGASRAATCDAEPETPPSADTKLSKDQPSHLDEGFDRAQRLASGRFEAADVAWLCKGFSAFLAAGGALPLERCLGLPRNDCALRRACRDYWLRRAWQALDDDLSPWRRSEKLAAVVRKFRMGRWQHWRMLEDAPILASDVELAVFEAFRSSERVPQSAMQLHNIAYHRRHS
jgi:hypothetical protein